MIIFCYTALHRLSFKKKFPIFEFKILFDFRFLNWKIHSTLLLEALRISIDALNFELKFQRSNISSRCDVKSAIVDSGVCAKQSIYSPNTEIKIAPQHVGASVCYYNTINIIPFSRPSSRLSTTYLLFSESSAGRKPAGHHHANSVGAAAGGNPLEARYFLRCPKFS